MSITEILASFAKDTQVSIVLSLIAADFVLGIAAALKLGTFRMTYIANFARNDLLGKVLPWFAVFALSKASGAAGLVGPIDWGNASDALFVIATGAMGGSILKSLADFGVTLPNPLAGPSPRP